MYVVAADVIATDLRHELILLDPRNGEMFSLNETGRYVWQRLPARSAVELAYKLESDLGVDAERACEDVQLLLINLEHAGLVQRLP